MKKSTKNLLAGLSIAAIGFMVCTLWEEDAIQNKIRRKRELEAEKRAEFIARRKAHAKAKRESAAAENAENIRQTEPAVLEEQAECQDVIAF